MEDRERYIEMRNKGNYSINFFYKFYLEKVEESLKIPPEVFNQLFPQYLQTYSEQVFEVLDKHYNITQLLNKEGRILKIY